MDTVVLQFIRGMALVLNVIAVAINAICVARQVTLWQINAVCVVVCFVMAVFMASQILDTMITGRP